MVKKVNFLLINLKYRMETHKYNITKILKYFTTNETFLPDSINEVVESNNFRFLQDVFSESLDNFYYSFAVDKISIREKIQLGKSALYSYTSYLLCFANPDKELSLEIVPKKFIIIKPDEGNYDSFMSTRWFNSMLLAIIFRETSKIDDLKTIDLKTLNINKISSLNSKLKYHLNNSLLNWDSLNGNDSFSWLLNEVEANYNNYNYKSKTDTSYFRFLRRNFILGLKDLKDGNKIGFNEHLEKCVQDHYLFYKQKRGLNSGDIPLHDTPEGMICLMGLVLAVMAYNKNWEITFQSDYLPEYLIQGKFD